MGDVARLAGVGTMSVSRLLNESGRVSPQTEERIRWAVNRLDYRMNEVARSLRGQRSRLIGVILPDISNPFFATCAHEIDRTAKSHGYMVSFTSSGEDSAVEEREAMALVQHNVDGLVVVPANSSADYLTRSAFADTPVIFLDRPGGDPERDSVRISNKEGVRLGIEHLIEQGHTRISFLGGHQAVSTMRLRYKAYRQVMNAHQLDPMPYTLCTESSKLDGIITTLLEGPNSPSALFTARGPTTQIVLASLRRLTLKMPGDIALLGFDDFQMADLIEPGISVVRQPVRQLGRVTAELLFRRVLGEEQDRRAIRKVLPLELIVRGSSKRGRSQVRTTGPAGLK